MNASTLANLTHAELCRYVDRSNPEVKELAERLEKALALLASVRDGGEKRSLGKVPTGRVSV